MHTLHQIYFFNVLTNLFYINVAKINILKTRIIEQNYGFKLIRYEIIYLFDLNIHFVTKIVILKDDVQVIVQSVGAVSRNAKALF